MCIICLAPAAERRWVASCDAAEGVRGSLLGVEKSELSFGQHSDVGHILTNSELIVRAWSILCFLERLPRAELDGARSRGRPRHHEESFQHRNLPRFDFLSKREHQVLLQQASLMSLNDIVFAELPGAEEALRRRQRDSCGEEFSDKEACSSCKIAMCCCRDHQRCGWKHHKPLCERCQASASEA